ncbi:PREDICTED: uncharacterized protein LOC105959833 [Erythranthe guttata]|uniref:uncharacterized protein LOC105959833 n=1 Tax=Erythranthe guttata TaxID=4155 RepID=UPI00064DAD98|nr:PREDICTED: uncharacterized protein LOC105959833 [Erythranthe guttata]|eukprot:XP_012839446.1 PREDICTED: uncharacterized protein LOC105959833 [Erythranthe guttata]
MKANVIGLTLKPLSQTRWESRIESVKPLLRQTEEVRNALLELAHNDEDGTITSEAEDMHMDEALRQLKGLIILVEDYRETGFEKAKKEAQLIATKLGVQPVFRTRRVIKRKRQFDENENEYTPQSAEETFRVEFFMFVVDQALTSLRQRFEDFQKFQGQFGFLLDLKKWKLIEDECLKASCVKLQCFLKNDMESDTDGEDLFNELRVLREILPKEAETAIGVLNYLKATNESFPNAWVAYRILLTIPVTVASAERSFSKLKLTKSYLRSTINQRFDRKT